MSERNCNLITKHALTAMALAFAALALVAGPAEAKSKRFTDTATYCQAKQPNGMANPCGALVYANATSNYYVNKVKLKARGTQTWDKNSACADLKMEDTIDLRVSEYGVFIVPAPCSYELTIQIGGGDSRSQDVFMTPGCQLVLESKGTTLNNNKPKVSKVVWTDEGKAAQKAMGNTVDKYNVTDESWHTAVGQAGVKHYCNKDDNADKSFN